MLFLQRRKLPPIEREDNISLNLGVSENGSRVSHYPCECLACRGVHGGVGVLFRHLLDGFDWIRHPDDSAPTGSDGTDDYDRLPD